MKNIFLRIICWFVPSSNMRMAIRHGQCVNYLKALYRYFTAKEVEYEYFLSAVLIIKDEREYINEWIEYHRLVGIDKFYIYDNDSSDNIKAELEPYIKSGIVEYKFFPGKGMQYMAYYDAIKHHMNTTKWMTFIDIDEFIVPTEFNDLKEFLELFDDSVSQIVLGWMMYGSSGHNEKPEGLVGNNYLYRGADSTSHLTKVIVNPRRVFAIHTPHILRVLGKTVDENNIAAPKKGINSKVFSKEKIRVNHYHCKSYEEYQKKNSRGDVLALNHKYTKKLFDRCDTNDIYDPAITKFTAKLK